MASKTEQQRKEAYSEDGPQSSSKREEEETESIGPVIPAHLLAARSTAISPAEEESDDDDYAPALPPDLVISRQNPERSAGTSSNSDAGAANVVGPAAEVPKRRRPAGPSYPTFENHTADHHDDDFTGPALPSSRDLSNSSDIHSTIQEIENRAKRTDETLKPSSQENEDAPNVRGEWMMVPPKNMSLTDSLKKPEAAMRPRVFSQMQREESTDNSEWTETPAQRAARKQELIDKKRKRSEPEPMSKAVMNRDRSIREDVEKHNRQSRPKSLMEMHAEKMLKDDKVREHDVSKKSWDRDRDLNAMQVNPSNLKDRLKKAGSLGSRFGGSRKGSYL